MSEYRDNADTDRCYFCPKRTDIEVHHIVPRRFNGTNERENLVAVCDRCHKKLERLYDSRFYESLGLTDETGERHSHFRCDSCEDQATVKMLNERHHCEFWWCLNCATPRLTTDRFVIEEDLTGEASYRLEWCRWAERVATASQFKSTSVEGLE